MSETKLSNNSERRFTERFRLLDGIIFYRKLRKFNWLNNFQGPYVLNDIASNSASFECPRDLGIKNQVELKINSPRFHKEIFVKGKILRRTTSKKSREFLYIVQFKPFGKGYQYNSIMSKEKMRSFIKSVQK